MKRELLIGLLMLLISGALYWGIMQIDGDEARLMPSFMAGLLALLSVIHVVEMYVKRSMRSQIEEKKEHTSETDRKVYISLFITFLSMVLFIYLLDKLGFYTTCYLYMILFPPVLVRSERSLKATLKRAATSAMFIGALYVLFNQYMVMQTPKGVLF